MDCTQPFENLLNLQQVNNYKRDKLRK